MIRVRSLFQAAPLFRKTDITYQKLRQRSHHDRGKSSLRAAIRYMVASQRLCVDWALLRFELELRRLGSYFVFVQGELDSLILAVNDETPTIKRFLLKAPTGFTFKAGQWVDFMAPNMDNVGGYTICSAPSQLHKQGTFELAVKRSTHPVALWLHEKAVPGVKVKVKVGGSFKFTDTDIQHPLLFFAGGIGVTPIISMLKHAMDLSVEAGNTQGGLPTLRAALLYSVKEPAELAFASTLRQLEQTHPGLVHYDFRVTGSAVKARQRGWTGGIGRFELQDVQAIVEALRNMTCQENTQLFPSQIKAYMCGPSSFEETMEGYLCASGVRPDNIKKESWW